MGGCALVVDWFSFGMWLRVCVALLFLLSFVRGSVAAIRAQVSGDFTTYAGEILLDSSNGALSPVVGLLHHRLQLCC